MTGQVVVYVTCTSVVVVSCPFGSVTVVTPWQSLHSVIVIVEVVSVVTTLVVPCSVVVEVTGQMVVVVYVVCGGG